MSRDGQTTGILDALSRMLGGYISAPILGKLLLSVAIFVVLYLLHKIVCWIIRRRIHNLKRYHAWRKTTIHVYAVLALVLIGRIWIPGIDSIATFLGLMSAGLAIALHDTIANIAGWLFILWRKPFKTGDRVQIGEVKGDVIDIRLFEFSLNEIGNWIDAEQSTGRIVHVPNSKVFQEPLANYETGFEYIWHEIPIMITFETDWKKAKNILFSIAKDKTEKLSDGAEAQIKSAAMKYLIFFGKLTPTVYTSVRESGVLLTMRYIIKPRERRTSEQAVWEAILEEFGKHDDIALAYPTMRYYQKG